MERNRLSFRREMPRISVVEAKTAISRTKLGFNYAINPYRGCAHGCIYCYAPYVLHETREWGSFVEARQNLPELLAREVRKVGKEEVVGIGTATDPYQPPEEEFCITKRCIQILKNTGRKCVIQTKSSLVLRDIDMLAGAEVGITITTTEPDIASAVEPRASSPEERLNALRELGRAGIKTFAFVGPVFPSIFRDPGEREKFFYEVAKAEPGIVMLDRFRVRVGMEEKIKRKAPEIYSKLFAEAFRYKYEDWDSLLSVLKEEVKKFGLRVGVAETEKW